MEVSKNIHALEIPFKIPIAPEVVLDRKVFVYLIMDEGITLVDSGVSGAHSLIFDYLQANGRGPKDITSLILSHSHPDHFGSARTIKEVTGCSVLAHSAEKEWIEDTEKQGMERPVPGFDILVEGPVPVDGLLDDGDIVETGKKKKCQVIHSPGHSRGSISLFFEKEKVLITGDALPVVNDLPIYEDVAACVQSIRKLKKVKGVDILLSSWEPPIQGKGQIDQRIAAGLSYLQEIHNAVLKAQHLHRGDIMALCTHVANDLGLPPSMVNPLVAKAFSSSLAVGKDESLFEIG